MESGSTKSYAPAVMAPEPEPLRECSQHRRRKGRRGAGGGDMGVGVAAPGTGPGLDFAPFTPALELLAVNYQPAGTRIHTSSWPPIRDAFSCLTYTAFVLGAVVTLAGKVPFGVVAMALAALGACGRGWWGGLWWAVGSVVVGVLGLVAALVAWGVLCAWLIRSAALKRKYCTEKNYTWRTSQATAKCQCSASAWDAVTMCCEYDPPDAGNSTCCLSVYASEVKIDETLCGGDVL